MESPMTLTTSHTQTETIHGNDITQADGGVVLKLRKPKRQVKWDENAIDNEHMGKKSSKCCCVYEKPRKFDESSSDDSDDDCASNCKGGHTHKELKQDISESNEQNKADIVNDSPE